MYSPPPPDPYPQASSASGGAADRPRYAPPVSPRPRDRLPTIRIPKPTLPQWLLLAGGLLILIGAFFPWTSISLGLAAQAKTISITGWQSAFGKATAVFGLAALALALAQVARLQLPRLMQEHGRTLYLLCGVEALLVTVLYLLDGERVVTVGTYAAASAGLGLYLALIGAGSIMVGSLSLRRTGSWLL
jgi:hypothetical protein